MECQDARAADGIPIVEKSAAVQGMAHADRLAEWRKMLLS
jgi:hypothetical protein